MATSHAQMISYEVARATGRTPARVLPAHVVASWRRCVEEYGLLPDRVRLPHVLTPSERLRLSAPIDDLIAMAKPEMVASAEVVEIPALSGV